MPGGLNPPGSKSVGGGRGQKRGKKNAKAKRR